MHREPTALHPEFTPLLRRQLRRAGVGLTDAVTVLDRDGFVRYQSLPVKWLLGYRPEQMIGRPLQDFLAPSARSGLQAMLRRVVRHGRLARRWRLPFQTASGNELVLEGRLTDHLRDPALPTLIIRWHPYRPLRVTARGLGGLR